MEEEAWQARIQITQIPEDVGYETTLIPMMASMRNEVEERRISKTWMIDPISDQIGYGLELHLSNDLSWTFFLSATNKKEAIKRGQIFLNFLENKFLGLTGEISVRPITEGFSHQKTNFFELRLPKTPLNFKIIEKVMQIFRFCPVKSLKVYLIWGAYYHDKVIPEAQRYYFLESYKVRIFLEVTPSLEHGNDSETYLAQLNGHLSYLSAGIKNTKLEYAIQCEPFLASWREILKATIVKQVETSTLINPENGDFTFPSNCTLKRANILKGKNYHYLPVSKEDPNYIFIGNLLHKGKNEKKPALIYSEDFRKNGLIAGQTGTGKSYLLKQLSNEFYRKCPLIGVLYLNLGKGNQEYFYKVDQVFKYGDPDLVIPYFVKYQNLDKSLQETASYLISSLGLREPLDKVLKTIMSLIYKKHQRLPTRLETLLKALKKWYEQHKYHEEYQTNIMTAFENRVRSLFSDPLLSKTLMLRENPRVPLWFENLCFGQKIMIDLSMCNSYVKLILSNALFQIVRTYTPDQEADQLKILIVIDEAHQIAELPNHYHANSDLYIARVQLEEIFSNLMREYRSKGVSFLIISNSHSNLFPCVMKLSSLKILFRMESDDARMLTSMQDDQRYLLLLEPQKALVLNGNTGERYTIKTIDFPKASPNFR